MENNICLGSVIRWPLQWNPERDQSLLLLSLRPVDGMNQLTDCVKPRYSDGEARRDLHSSFEQES